MNIVKTTILCPIALLAATMPTWAAEANLDTASDKGSVDRATQAAAMELAVLLHNEENMISNDDVRAKKFAVELFAADPELAQIEEDFPGVTMEIADATIPIANRSMRERLPVLWQRQANIYAANFDIEELNRLITFYDSPTGRKLVTGLRNNIKTENVVRSAKEAGSVAISAEAVQADKKVAALSILGDLNQRDRAALLEFGRDNLSKRLKMISLRIQQNVQAWADETTEWEAAETEAAINKIFEKRMAEEN